MTVFEPATEVLDFLTDESLRAGVHYGPPIADLLLTVPAEYRQAVCGEQHRRATRLADSRERGSTPALREERRRDHMQTWRAVVDEVLTQMAAS